MICGNCCKNSWVMCCISHRPLCFASFAVALVDQQCANRVMTGAAVGGALGASIGMHVSQCYPRILSHRGNTAPCHRLSFD